MFHSARIKLTVWYVIIIMFISMLFSLIIYEGINSEFRRFGHFQQIRLQREQEGISLQPSPFRPPSTVDLEMIEESRQRLTMVLIIVDLGILIISGGAAYFLAGKTLRPIKAMVDEQNRFITDASHELRTPLTALRTEIEVNLRDKKLSLDSAKTLLKSNLDEVVNLQSLSDNLLTLSQFQYKNGNGFFEDISLSEIMESVVKKITPLARQKNISINNKVKNYNLKGDKLGLTELFVILLDNAVKYSKKNSPVFLTSNKTDSVINIEVIDQGEGIKKEDLPFIFDRFYRVDKARSKEKITGYGLGLSIARKIAEMHKGSIDVTSKIGKGTKFTVSLPG